MLPIDQFKSLSEASRDGVCQFARLALEGQEKMLGLNIDAMQDFVEQSGSQVEQSWNDIAHLDPVSAWPALAARNLKCGMAINLLFLNTATRLCKDMAATTQMQFQAMNNEMMEEVGKYTSATGRMTAALVHQGRHHREHATA